MMKDEKAVKEQEYILDNILDREKSKTLNISEKSAITREKENLRFSSEYSKENKYLEDQNCAKELEKGLKDLVISENNQPIQVMNPIKRDGIKSFIVYTIKVQNSNEAIFRRFSDFFLLREKLISRWPGVYIPNIPPKIAVGNLETKIIEMRQKLLDKFCLRLFKFPFLRESQEMKLFLSSSVSDVKKALNTLTTNSQEDLLAKYKSSFVDFYEVYDAAAGRQKITDFQTFLKKALSNIRKKQQEIENYLCLISMFSDYEKYTLMEYADNDYNKVVFFNPKNSDLCLKLLRLREGLDNPYIGLLDWLQEEEIDVEAMNESISSLNALYENKEKLNQKYLANEKDLNDLNSGKSSLKTMFGLKSKKSEFEKLTCNKANLEKNLSDMTSLTRLATYNLETYIDFFKVEKLAGYYQALNNLADIQKKNANKINDLWSSVGQDKNIKKLINEINENNTD